MELKYIIGFDWGTKNYAFFSKGHKRFVKNDEPLDKKVNKEKPSPAYIAKVWLRQLRAFLIYSFDIDIYTKICPIYIKLEQINFYKNARNLKLLTEALAIFNYKLTHEFAIKTIWCNSSYTKKYSAILKDSGKFVPAEIDKIVALTDNYNPHLCDALAIYFYKAHKKITIQRIKDDLSTIEVQTD